MDEAGDVPVARAALVVARGGGVRAGEEEAARGGRGARGGGGAAVGGVGSAGG